MCFKVSTRERLRNISNQNAIRPTWVVNSRPNPAGCLRSRGIHYQWHIFHSPLQRWKHFNHLSSDFKLTTLIIWTSVSANSHKTNMTLCPLDANSRKFAGSVITHSIVRQVPELVIEISYQCYHSLYCCHSNISIPDLFYIVLIYFS